MSSSDYRFFLDNGIPAAGYLLLMVALNNFYHPLLLAAQKAVLTTRLYKLPIVGELEARSLVCFSQEKKFYCCG